MENAKKDRLNLTAQYIESDRIMNHINLDQMIDLSDHVQVAHFIAKFWVTVIGEPLSDLMAALIELPKD